LLRALTRRNCTDFQTNQVRKHKKVFNIQSILGGKFTELQNLQNLQIYRITKFTEFTNLQNYRIYRWHVSHILTIWLRRFSIQITARGNAEEFLMEKHSVFISLASRRNASLGRTAKA
jgi:hypothetical protein